MSDNIERSHAAQPQRSDQLKFIPPPSGAQLTWQETVRESCDQPQEWVIEPVRRSTGETWTGLAYINCGGGRLLGSMNEQVALAVIATHNAALAVERQRREQAEEISDSIARASKQVEESLRQQLLSAQAAIEQHNNKTYPTISDWNVRVDVSALRQHDDEVRKPLVEALIGQRYALVELSPLVRRGHVHLVDKAIRFIDNALAKVKS